MLKKRLIVLMVVKFDQDVRKKGKSRTPTSQLIENQYTSGLLNGDVPTKDIRLLYVYLF